MTAGFSISVPRGPHVALTPAACRSNTRRAVLSSRDVSKLATPGIGRVADSHLYGSELSAAITANPGVTNVSDDSISNSVRMRAGITTAQRDRRALQFNRRILRAVSLVFEHCYGVHKTRSRKHGALQGFEFGNASLCTQIDKPG